MAGVHLVDLDHVAVGGGVDELTVADVDAHVGDGLAGVVLEEDQIAGLQLIAADGDTVLELVGGGAVEGVAELGVDVLGEAGAVKAAGAVAAQDVGGAQILLGQGHNLLPQGGGGAGGGLGGDGDVIAADVTGAAGVCNLVPALVDALQLQDSAAGDGAQGVKGGAGARPHVQGGAVGVHLAIAQVGVGLGGHVQVLAGHVAFHGVVIDLVPAILGLLQHHYVGAAGSGGQDLALGGGSGAEPKRVGRDGAGTQGGGGGTDGAQGGENGAQQGDAQQARRLYHWYDPSIKNLFGADDVRLVLLVGQGAGQPDGGHVHSGVQTVLLGLLDHPVPALEVGVGELELNGHPGGHVQVVHLFGLHHLEHDDVFVGHAAVVDQVVLAAQGVTLVGQGDLFFGHDVPPKDFLKIVTKL